MILKDLLSKPLIFLLSILPLNFTSQVVINEISAHKGYIDEYDENTDWIEITNNLNTSIDLNNFYLSDQVNDLDKWQFPNYLISPQFTNSAQPNLMLKTSFRF